MTSRRGERSKWEAIKHPDKPGELVYDCEEFVRASGLIPMSRHAKPYMQVGRAYNEGDRIHRVRWRNAYRQPEPMRRGEFYRDRVGSFCAGNNFDEAAIPG